MIIACFRVRKDKIRIEVEKTLEMVDTNFIECGSHDKTIRCFLQLIMIVTDFS
jgi:hypothetical protein